MTIFLNFIFPPLRFVSKTFAFKIGICFRMHANCMIINIILGFKQFSAYGTTVHFSIGRMYCLFVSPTVAAAREFLSTVTTNEGLH